ncbi:MAG: hypothetical protein ABIJ92_01805 [Candidatus Aenigmatarchaeota archaeon]
MEIKSTIIMIFLFSILLSASVDAQAWKELLPCVGDETKFCGSNIGVCQAGTRTCYNGDWGPCTDSVDAISEVCGNGVDDNCDGEVDECIDVFFPLIGVLVVLILLIIIVVVKFIF